MVSVYNQGGQVVGWLNGQNIYSLQGQPIAFLSGVNVINYSAKHCGIYQVGHFLDAHGLTVGFIAGSFGGPKKPALNTEPAEPAKGALPAQPGIPASPASPAMAEGWSSLTWDQYLG